MKKKQFLWLAGDDGLGVLAEAPEDIDAAVKFLEQAEAWGAKADVLMAEAPEMLDARYVALKDPLFGRGTLYDNNSGRVVPTQALGGAEAVDSFASAVSRKTALEESIHVAPGGECELEFATRNGPSVCVYVGGIIGALRSLQPGNAEEEDFGPRP